MLWEWISLALKYILLPNGNVRLIDVLMFQSLAFLIAITLPIREQQII